MDSREISFPIKLAKDYDFNANPGRWRLILAVEIDGHIHSVDMGIAPDEKIEAARHIAPLFALLSDAIAKAT